MIDRSRKYYSIKANSKAMGNQKAQPEYLSLRSDCEEERRLRAETVAELITVMVGRQSLQEKIEDLRTEMADLRAERDEMLQDKALLDSGAICISLNGEKHCYSGRNLRRDIEAAKNSGL
jgi:predicted  nucleic acid-binding Zn-ribbon protein